MRVLIQEETTQVGGGCRPNNGWGNGDQNAPGNSLMHNRAENDRGLRTHKGVTANPIAGENGCGGAPEPEL